MKIMIDILAMDKANDIIDSTHKLIQFDVKDVPIMPYDTQDITIVADWLYTSSVDHEADMIIVNSISLRDELIKLGINTMSIG
jgi:hypothetical protein